MKTFAPLNEHEKMIRFISLITAEHKNVRVSIQNALNEIWGYDVMAFWVADQEGNIDNPALFGVPEKVIYDYVDHYELYDFLHPKLHIKKIQEQTIFNVKNTITHARLKDETYFMDFMKKYNFVDQMVVNFTYKEKLIGALGFLSKEKHGQYDQIDIHRFQVIASVITNKLVQSEKMEEMELEQEVLRRKMDSSKTAYVMINKKQEIVYKNESAYMYSDDLMMGKKTLQLEQLVEKVLKMYSRKGTHFNLMSIKYEYTIECISNFGFKIQNTQNSFLLIQIDRHEKNALSTIKNQYNLTKREMEVCHCIVEGMANEEIAKHLFITINTVKRHIQNIFQKLSVSNRTSIVRLFL